MVYRKEKKKQVDLNSITTSCTCIPPTGLMLTRIDALRRIFLRTLDLCFTPLLFAPTSALRSSNKALTKTTDNSYSFFRYK